MQGQQEASQWLQQGEGKIQKPLGDSTGKEQGLHHTFKKLHLLMNNYPVQLFKKK